jgi:hypothetical protein
MANGQSNPNAVRGGSVLLAILFLLLGGLKLVGSRLGLDVSDQFRGYPDWVCPLLGGIEVVAALILLVPRAAWMGAIMLLVVTAGYVWTSWQIGQPAQMLLPGLLFFACGVLTYLRFPKRSVGPS